MSFVVPPNGRGPGLVIALDNPGLAEYFASRGFLVSTDPGDSESLTAHPACARKNRFGLLVSSFARILPEGPTMHLPDPEGGLFRLRALDFFVENLLVPPHNLEAIWGDHVKYEFAARDTEATLETMVPGAYVNHIPVLTGGVGLEALREFYSQHFIPKMPPDTKLTPLSRTVGEDQIVDEMIFEFTHTITMDWMLPGIAPTNKHVRVPLVAIVKLEGDKLKHEHIYWDQASVLVQIGLLDPKGLPVAGAESAAKAEDPLLPSRVLA